MFFCEVEVFNLNKKWRFNRLCDQKTFSSHPLLNKEIVKKFVESKYVKTYDELVTSVQCKFCRHETTQFDFMMEHCYIIHFHCMECGQTFKDQDGILDHLASEHLLRVKCTLCSYTTFRPLKMDCHIQKAHFPGPYVKKRSEQEA